MSILYMAVWGRWWPIVGPLFVYLYDCHPFVGPLFVYFHDCHHLFSSLYIKDLTRASRSANTARISEIYGLNRSLESRDHFGTPYSRIEPRMAPIEADLALFTFDDS